MGLAWRPLPLASHFGVEILHASHGRLCFAGARARRYAERRKTELYDELDDEDEDEIILSRKVGVELDRVKTSAKLKVASFPIQCKHKQLRQWMASGCFWRPMPQFAKFL